MAIPEADVAHPSPPVREPEDGSSGRDHGQAVGIEAEEDDTTPTGRIDGVQAHVRF
jgi:hypothetical protein